MNGREIQESLLIFKDHLFQAQQQSMLLKKKSTKNVIWPAWKKLRHIDKYTKGEYRSRQHRRYRNSIQAYRDKVRKDKGYLQLNLVGDIKGKKKSFYKYRSSKKRTKACC